MAGTGLSEKVDFRPARNRRNSHYRLGLSCVLPLWSSLNLAKRRTEWFGIEARCLRFTKVSKP